MNLVHLETFVNLAQTLNYAATARQLFVSQPAVTQRIERLEKELGVALFQRTTKRVELTPAGRIFYEDCRGIVSRIDNAAAKAREHAHMFKGSMRIGCGTGGAVLEGLDALLRNFRASRPDIHLYVTQGNPVELAGLLGKNDLDAIFGACDESSVPSGARFEQLCTGSFIGVVNPESDLSAHGQLDLDDLRGESLIFLEDANCPSEMRAVQALIARRIPESIVYYSGSALISTIMIKAGMGIAVMPSFALPSIDGVVVRPIRGLPDIPYGVLHSTSYDAADMAAFLRCVHSVYDGALLPGEGGSSNQSAS